MKYDCRMLPNVCMECGLRFMSIMQLLHHVLSEHFKCSYTLIECPACQQSYQLGNIYGHFERSPECNDLYFECPQCDVCCGSGTDIIDHVLMKHSNTVTCHIAEDGGLCCFANDDEEESCRRPARSFLQKCADALSGIKEVCMRKIRGARQTKSLDIEREKEALESELYRGWFILGFKIKLTLCDCA